MSMNRSGSNTSVTKALVKLETLKVESLTYMRKWYYCWWKGEKKDILFSGVGSAMVVIWSWGEICQDSPKMIPRTKVLGKKDIFG